MDRVVYRLRQLPQDADRLEVVQLLSKAFGIESSAIHVRSLAQSTDPWVSSKIATLQFNETIAIQEILMRNAKGNINKSGDDWEIQVENSKGSLVLDTHFRGLTPLHDPAIHEADCIAISGLSSHPFGSWQPKGASKTFMWIRDALPKSLPNIRPILYGYDTTLVNSNSFQSILDLALGLLNQMKANGWSSPTSKPLLFLAHSLGGIVLKQALVSLANQVQRDDPLQKAIKGVISFGVPNLGMEQSRLMAMVDGQPTETIVADLSVDSEYLRQLDEQFAGIAHLQSVQLYWAYETRKSPTVVRNANGAWARIGPEEILVTQHSAARGLYQVHSRADSIFPINQNHSDMVKFAENDPDYNIVVHKLVQIVAQTKDAPASTSKLEVLTMDNGAIDSKTKISGILKSLDAPKRDSRLEQIEHKFRHTFDWVYESQKPGFNQWLQKGNGLFWINGKPGSGKSTLMKYITKNPETEKSLSVMKTSAVQIRARFFFHHRGNAMQKSFEGLLRSVLAQIIRQRGSLAYFLPQPSDNEDISSSFWTLSMLKRGLLQILVQKRIPIHICLFLDALDEYDGRLEPICRFLTDIARIPRKATRRIQICFSSRPWEIFTQEFGSCPGFSIHDYTKEDIRDFFLGSIKTAHISPTILADLVPDLVERAKGVFLWAKLVVKELEASSVNYNKQELEKRLRALPTELDEYYAEIIRRIPHVHRKTTYATLEIVVRSLEPLTPRDFVYALNSAGSKSYSECVAAYEAIQHQDATQPKRSFEDLAKHRSNKYGGGLLEIVEKSNGKKRKSKKKGIQVFHQTVEDFVMSPKFKTLVLGDLAKITFENGYTFLTKFYLREWLTMKKRHLRGMFQGNKKYTKKQSLIRYAQAAEETTGRSMKDFWESTPFRAFGGIWPATTILGFGVRSGLQLFVSEMLAENPEILPESTELLISCAIHPIIGELIQTSIIRLILQAGFKVNRDPGAFSSLVSRIDSAWYYQGSSDRRERHIQSLEVIRMLLERGHPTGVDVNLNKGGLYLSCKPLHLGPPLLADLLLEYGANVNILDFGGKTPLDHMCGRRFEDGRTRTWTKAILNSVKIPPKRYTRVYREKKSFYEDLYRTVCLLVAKGGTTQKTSADVIRLRLEEFAIYGWETESLYRALLPVRAPSGK